MYVCMYVSMYICEHACEVYLSEYSWIRCITIIRVVLLVQPSLGTTHKHTLMFTLNHRLEGFTQETLVHLTV